MRGGVGNSESVGSVLICSRHADKLGARQPDGESRLIAVVREGKTTRAEPGSGTFTLNNYGAFGVDGSAVTINFTEGESLASADHREALGWSGELAVRKVTELALTFKKRVCDGGTAGSSCATWRTGSRILGPCWRTCEG